MYSTCILEFYIWKNIIYLKQILITTMSTAESSSQSQSATTTKLNTHTKQSRASSSLLDRGSRTKHIHHLLISLLRPAYNLPRHLPPPPIRFSRLRFQRPSLQSLFSPSTTRKPIPEVLFVERRLRASGSVCGSGPVLGRVWCEGFVYKDDGMWDIWAWRDEGERLGLGVCETASCDR